MTTTPPAAVLAETAEQIAARCCPCSKINNYCDGDQHWYGCPAANRLAVTSALQALMDEKAELEAELFASRSVISQVGDSFGVDERTQVIARIDGLLAKKEG